MTGRRKDKGKQPRDVWFPKEREQGSGELPRDQAETEEVGEHVGRVNLGDLIPKRRSRHRHGGAKARVAFEAVHASSAEVQSPENDIGASMVHDHESDTSGSNGQVHDRVEEQTEETRICGPAQDGAESALQRLETIVKAFEEPSTSPVELEMNLQEQADEILALEAIYGEDLLHIKDAHRKGPSFTISVKVDIPENLTLEAVLPCNSELQMPEESLPTNDSPNALTSSSSRLQTKHLFTVQSLPPIQLVITLPPSYPSHSPPLFIMQVLWLNSANLSKLCTALDKIWNDQQGQVVLYSWIEWLQTQSLTCLEISENLELGPYEVDGTVFRDKEADPRALSACCSFDSDLGRLLHYNEELKAEEFCRSLHMCNICLTEHIGKEFAKMPCQHMFCWSCMGGYASVHVKEGSVNQLCCPDTTCRSPIPPFILKRVLDEDTFDRWDKLVLQRSLDAMEDIVYCPRCERVCIEEKDHFVQCGGCFFSFCSLCRQTWHVGQECVSPEARLLILQGRQKRGSGEEQRRKEQQLLNELMNMQYVRREAKQCPKCKMAISKTEGCNKMACSNCGQFFCFKCVKAIDGYDHFRDGSCQLFEEEEIVRWQPQMLLQEQQAQVELQLELWPERGRPCPNCRQLNVKNGNNNHIYCWACRNSYCCLCNKVVRKTSEHYGLGPAKCRQHTAD